MTRQRLANPIWILILMMACGLGCHTDLKVTSKTAPVEAANPKNWAFAGVTSVKSTYPETTTLTWEKVSNANVKGYKIYQQDFAKPVMEVSAADATITIKNLVEKSSVSYGVRAFNASGVEDQNSILGSTTVLAFAQGLDNVQLALPLNSETNSQSMAIMGGCLAHSTIIVSLNNQEASRFTCDGSGHFKTTFDISHFPDGSYAVTALEISEAGVPSRPTSVGTLFRDVTPPTISISQLPKGTTNDPYVLPHLVTSQVAAIRWAYANGTSCDSVTLSEWSSPDSLTAMVFSDSGSKIFCIKARDKAGNETPVFSKNWVFVNTVSLASSATTSTPGAAITLTANVSALAADAIARVDFYEHDLLIGSDATAPFTLALTPARGLYSFSAKVIYHGSLMASPSVTVSVPGYEARVVFQVASGLFTIGNYGTEGGSTYGTRGVFPYQYGWTVAYNGSCLPSLLPGFNYVRNLDTDRRRHYGCDLNARTWELEAPAGTYSVKVNQGSPDTGMFWYGTTNYLSSKVEGVAFVNQAWSPNNLFATAIHDVTVSDGKVTLQSSTGSGSSNMVNFIEVVDARGQDVQAPTVPNNVVVALDSIQSFYVTWSPSTDNKFVASYLVYVNGLLKGETTDLLFTLTNLSPNSTYSVQVAAKDQDGNISAKSEATSATTNNKGLHCPHTNDPIVLDGALFEPVWATAVGSPITRFTIANNLTSNVFCTWNSTGIHFAIAAVGVFGASEKVEIYFDSTNERPITYQRNKQFKVECPRGSACSSSSYISDPITAPSVFGATSDGYVFEVSLDWTNFPGVTPVAGKYFGFDAQIHHDVASSPVFFWWQSIPDSNWTGATEFGTVVLD